MKKPTILDARGHVALDEDQKACIELVKETLAQCLEGNIHSIGIVACLDGGFGTAMAGRRAGDLNLGCDKLKRDILDATTEAGDATLRRFT